MAVEEGSQREAPSPELRSQVEDVLRHSDLVNVAPISVAASVAEDRRDLEADKIGLSVAMAHHSGPGEMENRFRYRVALLSADDIELAVIEFILRVEYDVEEGYEPPAEAVEFIADTTGRFAAYPYARELAQSLTTRLQFDPVVLGLMPRGVQKPRGVSRVVRSVADAPERSEASGV